MVLVSDRHMSDVFFIDGVSVVPTYGSWSQIGICRTCFLLMAYQWYRHMDPGLRYPYVGRGYSMGESVVSVHRSSGCLNPT